MTGLPVVCAIHQPNFLPRLSTLAKLYAADIWVVLEDVQFTARDYQHRARLASLDGHSSRWLSLAVHRPHGRASRISDIELVDQDMCRKRTLGLTCQHYARSPYWPHLRQVVDEVADVIDATRSLTAIATVSTLALLRILGWRGQVRHSSDLPARPERSGRLADLARAVGADLYLCGPGGSRYLDPEPFGQLGIHVEHFATPTADSSPVWTGARSVSTLWALAAVGPEGLRVELDALVPSRITQSVGIPSG